MKYVVLFISLLTRNIKWVFFKVKYRKKLMPITIFEKKMLLNIKEAPFFDFLEKNIFKQLALDNIRELEASKIMLDFIEPGDQILEIGANVGYYVLLESYALKQQGKIYAIEPDPDNFELLKKNIEVNKLNNIVNLYNLAISNKKGKADFYISRNSNLHSLLLKKNDSIKNKIEVETVKVDDFLIDKPNVNFIRMDIEGYECKVINGLNVFLQKSGKLKLFIELHPHLVDSKELVKLLKILKRNEFKVYKTISRDNALRKILKQTVVEEKSIDELIKDAQSSSFESALEVFFVKD